MTLSEDDLYIPRIPEIGSRNGGNDYLFKAHFQQLNHACTNLENHLFKKDGLMDAADLMAIAHGKATVAQTRVRCRKITSFVTMIGELIERTDHMLDSFGTADQTTGNVKDANAQIAHINRRIQHINLVLSFRGLAQERSDSDRPMGASSQVDHDRVFDVVKICHKEQAEWEAHEELRLRTRMSRRQSRAAKRSYLSRANSSRGTEGREGHNLRKCLQKQGIREASVSLGTQTEDFRKPREALCDGTDTFAVRLFIAFVCLVTGLYFSLATCQAVPGSSVFTLELFAFATCMLTLPLQFQSMRAFEAECLA